MRKNVNKKSNNKSKVVSALAMLLVSAVALSSASYAWFTMSKSVKVDGIQLQATAPDNVLIATNSDAFETITPYASTKTLEVAEGKKDVLKGGVNPETAIAASDLLLPCSSATGVNLYNTLDIKDSGEDKGADSKYTTSTNTAAATELYYVDVPLYILTTGSKNVNVAIDTEKSSIETVAGGEIYNAVRFAVLDDAMTTSKGVYTMNKEMFTGATPVESVVAEKANYAENDAAILLGNASNIAENNKIELKGTANMTGANVDTNKYQYTKVVVRVWIEGQNKNCVTANANQKFKFNLTFKAVE
ncbi:hypothetical protein [uncultured Eubacterium sp.]|uniref:hypothetical protein n=1 Tax=uncultured Eubacterium sp. TaxID=165185 RepID=UPI003264301C